jgi:Trk-type K+ transport system membrane component
MLCGKKPTFRKNALLSRSEGAAVGVCTAVLIKKLTYSLAQAVQQTVQGRREYNHMMHAAYTVCCMRHVIVLFFMLLIFCSVNFGSTCIQSRVVTLYRRLGTTYRSHLQGSRSPETSVKDYDATLRNVKTSADLVDTAAEA